MGLLFFCFFYLSYLFAEELLPSHFILESYFFIHWKPFFYFFALFLSSPFQLFVEKLSCAVHCVKGPVYIGWGERGRELRTQPSNYQTEAGYPTIQINLALSTLS